MKQIILGAVSFLIVFLVISATKKSKEKVNEYKSKRNPDDLKSLEKYAYNQLDKNPSEGVRKMEELFEKSPTNILANLFLGPYYYKKDEKDKGQAIIINTVENLLNEPEAKKYIDNLKYTDLFAYTYYYYGYLLHEKGKETEAKKWKKKAKKFNLNFQITEKENLY
jgi:hypothetical protein